MADEALTKLQVYLEARIDQFERSMKKAQATSKEVTSAIENDAAAMDKKVFESFAKTGASNRMAMMELAHSGRALSDALIAGMSPARAFLMETPRLMQTLGMSGVGGSLLFAGGAALAAGAAFMGTLAIVHSMADSYKQLEDAAKLTGISIEDLNRIQEQAGKSGSGFSLDKNMASFAEKIREAQVTGNDLQAKLEAIGIKIVDATGKALPLKQVIDQVTEAIAKGNNELAKRRVAEAVGIGADNVKFAEDYAAALEKGATAAGEVDAKLLDLKKRASETEAEWNKFWASWATTAKTAILDVINFMSRNIGADDSKTMGRANILKRAYGDKNPFTQPSDGLTPFERAPITIGKKTNPRLGDNASAAFAEAYQIDPRLDLSAFRDKPTSGGSASSSSSLDQIERYIEQLRLAKKEIEAEISLWGKSKEAREQAVNLAKLDYAAKRAGREATEEEKNAVTALTHEYATQEEQLKRLKEFQAMMANFKQDLATAFDDLIVKGKDFNSVLASLLQNLASMILKRELLGADGTGGLFGSLFSALPSLFGSSSSPLMPGAQRAASGTSFAQGGVTLVGENGPELVSLPRGSVVMPTIPTKQMMAGGGGTMVTVNQTFTGDANPQLLAEMAATIEARAKAGVWQAIGRGQLSARAV